MNLTATDMIAGLALMVSTVAAWTTWRVHKDSGGRVNVKMNAAAYVPYAGAGKLVTNNSGAFLLQESREPAVELAQVVIENPGRTGVTVTEVRLSIGGLDRGVYQVGPRSFQLEGFGGQDAASETYFRLEPYDRKTLLLDYWSVVDAEFRKDPSLRELTVHAEVTVAGHDFPFDSKGHGHWRIQRQFLSSFDGHSIRRPRNIVLTEFLRHNSRDLSVINYMDQFAVTAEDTTDPSWDYTKFGDHLEQLLNRPSMDLVHLGDTPMMHHMPIHEIYTQLQGHGDAAKPFPLLDHRRDYYEARGLTTRKDLRQP